MFSLTFFLRVLTFLACLSPTLCTNVSSDESTFDNNPTPTGVSSPDIAVDNNQTPTYHGEGGSVVVEEGSTTTATDAEESWTKLVDTLALTPIHDHEHNLEETLTHGPGANINGHANENSHILDQDHGHDTGLSHRGNNGTSIPQSSSPLPLPARISDPDPICSYNHSTWSVVLPGWGARAGPCGQCMCHFPNILEIHCGVVVRSFRCSPIGWRPDAHMVWGFPAIEMLHISPTCLQPCVEAALGSVAMRWGERHKVPRCLPEV